MLHNSYNLAQNENENQRSSHMNICFYCAAEPAISASIVSPSASIGSPSGAAASASTTLRQEPVNRNNHNSVNDPCVATTILQGILPDLVAILDRQRATSETVADILHRVTQVQGQTLTRKYNLL